MVATPCWLVLGAGIYKKIHTYTQSSLLAFLSFLAFSLLLRLDGLSGRCGGVVRWVVFLGVEALAECSSMAFMAASSASRRSLLDLWTASLLTVSTHHRGGALTCAVDALSSPSSRRTSSRWLSE